jgi:hypothetical protein
VAYRSRHHRWRARKRLTNRLTRWANLARFSIGQSHKNPAKRNLSNPVEAPPHNPKVAGSNPVPAIGRPAKRACFGLLRWVQKWASNTLAVRRAFVGAVLREQSGRKELPSRESVIADLRVRMNDALGGTRALSDDVSSPGSGDSRCSRAEICICSGPPATQSRSTAARSGAVEMAEASWFRHHGQRFGFGIGRSSPGADRAVRAGNLWAGFGPVARWPRIDLVASPPVRRRGLQWRVLLASIGGSVSRRLGVYVAWVPRLGDCCRLCVRLGLRL